jgi:hypothetical protein
MEAVLTSEVIAKQTRTHKKPDDTERRHKPNHARQDELSQCNQQNSKPLCTTRRPGIATPSVLRRSATYFATLRNKKLSVPTVCVATKIAAPLRHSTPVYRKVHYWTMSHVTSSVPTPVRNNRLRSTPPGTTWRRLDPVPLFLMSEDGGSVFLHTAFLPRGPEDVKSHTT